VGCIVEQPAPFVAPPYLFVAHQSRHRATTYAPGVGLTPPMATFALEFEGYIVDGYEGVLCCMLCSRHVLKKRLLKMFSVFGIWSHYTRLLTKLVRSVATMFHLVPLAAPSLPDDLLVPNFDCAFSFPYISKCVRLIIKHREAPNCKVPVSLAYNPPVSCRKSRSAPATPPSAEATAPDPHASPPGGRQNDRTEISSGPFCLLGIWG
jgi:hypothetical protein